MSYHHIWIQMLNPKRNTEILFDGHPRPAGLDGGTEQYGQDYTESKLSSIKMVPTSLY